jgi:7,8-dihydroneopterin aldolase/epimerase/oxygenase
MRATVFVRRLTLDAQIGVHLHEHGRSQPLVVDIEVDIDSPADDDLAQTLDYTRLADRARELAAQGHLKLAEAFAERLARACLEEPLARRVRVRVEKPEALAPDAEGAGAEIMLARS